MTTLTREMIDAAVLEYWRSVGFELPSNVGIRDSERGIYRAAYVAGMRAAARLAAESLHGSVSTDIDRAADRIEDEA